MPNKGVWICPEDDQEPQKQSFLFSLPLQFFLFLKKAYGGASLNPCFGFALSLSRTEESSVGLPLRRKCQNAHFPKVNGLLFSWETASPDPGFWES